METLKFHKTECGVEFLLNVIHFKGAEFSYPRNIPFKTDFFEIIFFRRGSGNLLLNHQRINLADNTIIFMSPFQRRQWHFDNSEQEFTILLFQEDFLNEFFADKLFAYRLTYFYQLHFPLSIRVDGNIIDTYCTLLKEIKAELVITKSDSIHIVRSLLYYILHKLNRKYAGINHFLLEEGNDNIALRFKQLLEVHIKDKQRVTDYSSLLGISRITLNNAVKQQFNITATTLLKQRLILEIKNYLMHSNLTVSQIADELKFSEPNHLMRFFKTLTGYTTSEFLNDARKIIV